MVKLLQQIPLLYVLHFNKIKPSQGMSRFLIKTLCKTRLKLNVFMENDVLPKRYNS